MSLLSCNATLTARVKTPFEFLHTIHHRDQFPNDLDRNRTYRHYKQRRQDAKKDGEDELHSKLGGFLLGNEARLHAHKLGVCPQTLRYTCTKAIRLYENCH